MGIFQRISNRKLHKKAIQYLCNIQYSNLIQASERVQAYCINEEIEVFNNKAFFHHFPLKDNSENYLFKDNWDLSDTIKEEITESLNTLDEYRHSVYYAYHYNNKGKFDLSEIEFKHELLPPWIVFPHYSALSSAWRQGWGEVYMDIFIDFIRSLSHEQYTAYFQKYSIPEYMETNSFEFNFANHILRGK